MSKFMTSLLVQQVDGVDQRWIVKAPLCYLSDVAQTAFIVPVDFETDFASVPRIPLVFDALGDIAHAAAVVHDRLYATCEVSRAVADEVFREACVVCGLPAWKARAMWMGVRVFGAKYYGKAST